MMIPAEKLERIRDHAVHMDWNVAFGGKSKGNKHLERVVRTALSLCRDLDAREDIVIAGAWLHDIGLHLGNKGHCFSGASSILPFLKKLQLEVEDISAVTHCIEAHDGEVEARTIEAKVVHDADTLDKMGPLGFIRHTWKIANITTYTPAQLMWVTERHLPERLEKVYLPSAKARAHELDTVLTDIINDRDLLTRLTSMVAERSRFGVPTEKIVVELVESRILPDDAMKILVQQLNPS